MSEFAIIKAQDEIIKNLNLEVEALQQALLYMKGVKWAEQEPFKFQRLCDKFRGEVPAFLIEAREYWMANKDCV